MAEPPGPRLEDPPRRIGDRLESALEHRADLEGEIARGEAKRPSRRRIAQTLGWVTLTGVSLYLVAPALLESLASWDQVGQLDPRWAACIAGLQLLAFGCLWWLQRVAMHDPPWHAVVTCQLAGNAISKVAPGGGAVGAALQYRMLIEAGVERVRAVGGLATANLLTLAIVLALPVLALPALWRGAVDRDLTQAALAGAAVFAVLFAVGAAMLVFDRPLAWVGRVVQRVRNRVRRRAAPLSALPARLLRERDRILATVGRRWKAALAAGVGRWAFDYGSLLAALAAVGASPRPALVLLAFCAAQLLAQVPLTPGGLGVVEAGLTGGLVLAGVAAGDAVLATFAYRLFTFWLPIPLGLLGALLHRRRLASRGATAMT
jgi:uncharacterized protein (TIRG00374 family)